LADAGRGVPEVIILDPSGHKNTVPVKVRPISQDMWRCEYVSPATGLHSVNVFFAGQPIPNSPYGVRVAPGMFAKFLLYCDSRIKTFYVSLSIC
jgi:filamin